VAGVVAESTNNGVALTGLAYGASIMPVRILDASGLGDEATIAKGVRYAVAHHAQIINLSLEFLPNEVTSASDIPAIVSAINFAHARGVLVVGAAGNDQSNQIAYPARTHGVVSVGATTKDVCLADYSNNGSSLSLVAPGGGSDAVMPGNPLCHPDRNLPSIYQLTLTSTPHWAQFGYPSYYIGTSMSAPEVSATAALVIASGVIGRRPSPAQLLARLEQTATPLGGRRHHGVGRDPGDRRAVHALWRLRWWRRVRPAFRSPLRSPARVCGRCGNARAGAGYATRQPPGRRHRARRRSHPGGRPVAGRPGAGRRGT